MMDDAYALVVRNSTSVIRVPYTVTERIFTSFAFIPAVFVWIIIYRFSPKANFQLNDPYTRMQLLYAVMSGIMIGQLLGHALPNATMYSDSNVPYLAAIIGIIVVMSFLKLCRVFGYAKNQVIGSTQYEPTELYNEEGDETSFVVVGREELLLDDGPLSDTNSFHTDEESKPLGASHSILTGNDAWDVRWIRRRMFEILYTVLCIMTAFEGLYLVYNASNVSPVSAIIAFYVMKSLQAFMLACYAVFAYNHKRTTKFIFLGYYAWAVVGFSVAVVLSTVPILMGISHNEISTIVESRIFSGFYELFAGILAAVAFDFTTREEFNPTKQGELSWLGLFTVGSVVMWGLGLVV